MDQNKILSLAFEFNKAPKEVQAAANAHKANVERLEIALKQMKLWRAEIAQARKDLGVTEQALSECMSKWEPEGFKSQSLANRKV